MISNRVNVFIRKVKEAAAKEDKAKSVPKAAPALPEAPPPVSIEPVFASLEEALEAAHKCSSACPLRWAPRGAELAWASGSRKFARAEPSLGLSGEYAPSPAGARALIFYISRCLMCYNS